MDIGLRNNFKKFDEIYLMENIIYNELLIRGYDVDVGIVKLREKRKEKNQKLILYVINIYKRYYIKCVSYLETRKKTIQEEKVLMNINDNFKKIIIVKDYIKNWYTEEGILVIEIQEFLLNQDSLDI